MHELLTNAEMREADRLAIVAGTSGFELMERAGAGVAEAVARHGAAGEVAVLVGNGNNGGDGYVCATILRERGRRVTVHRLPGADAPRRDAARAAAAWGAEVGGLAAGALPEADIYVDALFGSGLSRELTGGPKAVVEALNHRTRGGKIVIAVDIPSGIDGDTGEVRGAAVAASETVTFFARKPGHLLLPGRLNCGPVTVADIGIGADVLRLVAPKTRVNHPDVWRELFPTKGLTSHKYSHGHVLVVAGGLEGVGAPRLAARAALRVGAGLVTVVAEPEAIPAHAGRAPDAMMLRSAAGGGGVSSLLADKRRNVVVIGPALGLDPSARAKVEAALAADAALVLDADALTALAGRLPLLRRSARKKPTILTPHEGEFARLFSGESDISKSPSKLERARRAAQMTGCVVMLKGADTVIAAPDGRATINENAPPSLATAGSGDVLAGLVGGLLAQGMPAFEAAAAAVWLHGDAASLVGIGLIADDLIEALPQALAQLTSNQVAIPAS